MPITITPTSPVSLLGPGIELSWTSDFVGPLPTGTQFTITISDDAEGTRPRWSGHEITTVNFGGTIIGVDTPWIYQNNSQYAIQTGTTAHAIVELVSGATGHPVLDSGAITGTYDTTEALPTWIAQELPQILPTGGLTPGQAAQLTDIQTTVTDTQTGLTIPITDSTGTHDKTIAQVLTHTTLDQFVSSEITSGETPDPVRATIGAFWYSIVVQVTTIADDLVAMTPDAQWYLPDLAVLRIIRGTDVESRHGCHLPDQEFFNPLNQLALAFAPSELLGIPTDFTLAVDWRAGCAGRVFLKVFP